jgi:proline iminopeptidase
MMAIEPVDEGYLSVTGGMVWYQIIGAGDADGAGDPLVLLHGGPGFPSDYLSPLAALGQERPVVFYDQLGCGRSGRPIDSGLWRLERFVAEVGQVLAGLNLTRYHLLGHSWGAMLALDYALGGPAGLRSLILASPPLSLRRWLADAARYRAALPKAIREALDSHEAAGTIDTDAYAEAMGAYYARHVCRLDPSPEPLLRAREGFGQAVYRAMWGPSEFVIDGNLGDYERADRLPALAIPTLFTCGLHDEASPEATAFYAGLVPGAQTAVFERSSHLPHLEEPDAYLGVTRAFLRGVERRAGA